MKKIFIPLSGLFLFAIVILNRQCNAVHSNELPAKHERGILADRSLYILDSKGSSSQELLDLLDATNIQHDGTLESIVKATQCRQDKGGWLRIPGKERWEVKEIFPEKRAQLMTVFDKLGTIKEIEPTHNYYNYALILGATVPRMRSRLQYLIELWEKGVRFDSINVLVGQRPLDPNLESPEILLDKNNTMIPFRKDWQLTGDLPTTEAEAAKLIFEQSPLPAEWDNLSVMFVDTPMQPTGTGKLRRPTTQDSIIYWLKTDPKPGSILAISNQPYAHYQDTVLRCSI
ncbi:MAG TPA: hypothetical protein ENI08_01390, partial [Candidatus Dependentiae bacterium]|nr:hypothetical protein [Candidatus Dependentiae bacterium]